MRILYRDLITIRKVSLVITHSLILLSFRFVGKSSGQFPKLPANSQNGVTWTTPLQYPASTGVDQTGVNASNLPSQGTQLQLDVPTIDVLVNEYNPTADNKYLVQTVDSSSLSNSTSSEQGFIGFGKQSIPYVDQPAVQQLVDRASEKSKQESNVDENGREIINDLVDKVSESILEREDVIKHKHPSTTKDNVITSTSDFNPRPYTQRIADQDTSFVIPSPLLNEKRISSFKDDIHQITPSDDSSLDKLQQQNSPIPSLMNELEQQGIIDYSSAGKHKNNGSPKLTEYGRELHRRAYPEQYHRNSNAHLFSPKDPSEYDIVRLDIDEDTEILSALQSHPLLIVRGTEDLPAAGLGIGTLTSQISGKSGATEQPNIILSDVKLNETKQDQYIRPLIPPVEVSPGKAEIIEQSISYLQIKTPEEIEALVLLGRDRGALEEANNEAKIRQTICESIKEQVITHPPILYSRKGYTAEELNTINDLHKQETKQLLDDSTVSDEVD